MTDDTIDLDKARRAKKINDALAKKTKPHIVLGTAVLQDEPIMIVGDEVWRYEDNKWTMVEFSRQWLDRLLEIKCRELKLKSSTRLIREARDWIWRDPNTYKRNIPWDQHGKIAIKSGLLDPITHKLEKAKREHYVTVLSDIKFDPKANCPLWLQLLGDMFDQPIIDLLQEMLGMGFIINRPKELSRAAVFWGGSDTGKTQMVNILPKMISDEHIPTPLSEIEKTHGTSAFTSDDPWVLQEAFNHNQWHLSGLTKQIIEGENIPINRKNHAMTYRRYAGAVFWATNFEPQFKETTRAISNRIIIIPCRRVFTGTDVGVMLEAQRQGYSKPYELILAREKPGILNWALVGMKRAIQRGRYELPKQLKQMLENFYQDSNLVAGWEADERITPDKNTKVLTSDLTAAFTAWYMANRGEDAKTPSNNSITKLLKAHNQNFVDIKLNGRRYVGGISLTKYGLDDWQIIKNGGIAANREINLSPSRDRVNCLWKGE